PALAVRRRPPPGPSRAATVVAEGHVVQVAADPDASPFAHASLWALTESLPSFLDGLPGPPYELADAYQRAIDSGERVLAVELGETRDLTHPADLVKENFPYLRST
ncbi:MAG: hypothetical protein WBB74_10410, partial [Gaiellaceae bacterium]